MAINYTELREILERKANKAINHLDELKCFVPEFRDVLDSVLYISETLKDLMFLDTECPDCKKEKLEGKPVKTQRPDNPGDLLQDLIGKPYNAYKNQTFDPDRVVLFYSEGCGPCQKLTPILERVTKDLHIQLEKVLVDDLSGEKHAMQYNIMGWPTVFYIKNNTVVEYATGADMSKTDEEIYNAKYVEIKGVYVYENWK